MISTSAKARQDRYNYYGRYHGKDYDALANEYVSERETKIAKEKSAKMSPKDKEAAKDLAKLAESDNKKEGEATEGDE